MSLDRIAGVFLQPTLSNGQRFVLPSDDLMSKVTLGQVLKGRVLRHIEGSRYSVEYGGKEKVVDSGVPLKTGELLYGRVVGLGDQVELERISAPHTTSTTLRDVPKQIASDAFSGSKAELVVHLFTEFGASLNEKDAAILQQAMRAMPAQEPTIYAGLLLAKLGLPFTLERLDAVTRALIADPKHALFDERIAIQLASQPIDTLAESAQADNDITHDTEFMRMLSDLTDGSNQTSMPTSSGNEHSDQDSNADSRSQRDLAYVLLNLQTDGSIRHHVTTIPLIIDGSLVELNIGMIEQREARPDQMATTHRRLVFTLNTDALGTIAVDGTLTGDHVQLKFNVDNANALDHLDAHADLLKVALQQANFQVDVIRHDVRPWQEMPSAAWLTTHAVIRNDSLDRRI